MRAIKHERRDWAIIALILLFGLFFMLLAGRWALRFAPRWELDANVESLIDPNSDFLTRRPGGFIEPVDPAILTNPAGMYAFLTPGASSSTATQTPATTDSSVETPTAVTLVATQTAASTSIASVTNTALVFPSPTKTSVFFPPSPTSTSMPNPVFTSTASVTSTSTPTSTSTAMVGLTPTSASSSTTTATATQTPTATSTTTATATPTSTPPSSSTLTVTATLVLTVTHTPDLGEPDFGGPDGNAIVLGNGMWVEFNLSGFLLDGNSSFDVVYYEKEETGSAGKIHLGAVLIEVYDQTTAAWYAIYHWGNGAADTNASYNNAPEPDGYPVDMSLLSGAPPLDTGIAIDIDSVALGQGGAIGDSITKIRITSLSSVKCDIDSLQMLR